jgi:hypothetical protein
MAFPRPLGEIINTNEEAHSSNSNAIIKQIETTHHHKLNESFYKTIDKKI